MKFTILVITYVFTQLSSCVLSDNSTEDFVPTNLVVSTSAYLASDFESETEEASSNNSTFPSLVAETNNSNQGTYDTTTISNLRSVEFAKITWNPVSSAIVSTDSPTKSSNYVNTLASTSLQNNSQHSGSITVNYQTPPSIFENLDHEENELDSDTRVTDVHKGLKTTLDTDLPLLYAHKETDSPSISYTSTDNSLSENEPISGKITEHKISVSEKMENSTGISLSDHTSFSFLTFSNPELFTENKETASILTRNETVTPDSNLFVSIKSTETETENIENATVNTDSMAFLYKNSKSTTSSNTESNAENREQTSNLYYSSSDHNATYTESSIDLESVETFASSEKSKKEVEFTFSTRLEQTTPASSVFDLSEKSDEMITSTSKIVLETIDMDNLTPEGFPATISDSLHLDASPNTSKSPITVSTFYDELFLQTISKLQENHTSTTSENITSRSNDMTTINSTDQENLSISTLTSNNKPSTTADDLVTNSPEKVVSSDFHLNTATVFSEAIESKGSQTVSASISEDIEIEKTTMSSVHSTEQQALSNEDTNETEISSLQSIDSTKYDIGKEASMLSTSVKPALGEITTSLSYSLINTFEDTSKLLTTTEHYFPSSNIPLSTRIPNDNEESNNVTYLPFHRHVNTEGTTDSSTKQSTASQTIPSNIIPLSTVTPNDIEESNTVTYLPFPKHMNTESTTDSSTKQSIVTQTIPYHWLLSTKTELTTNVSSDVEKLKYTTAALSSHEDPYRETSTDVSIEQNIVTQTVPYYPISSTNFEQSFSSATDNVFSSLKTIHDLSTEETTTSRFESYTVTDEFSTSLSDSYSNSAITVTTDISSMPPETHREGKHIPFSTASTVRVTDPSSEHGFLLVTTKETPVMKAAVNDTEVHYKQIKFEEINAIDRTNTITAIIQFPADSVHEMNMKVKLARTHNWLDKVLTKEFQNWTGDPFQNDEEQGDEIPFGNISIFYVKPTPETNASHITLTFVVYNAWRNRTLPVDFVPGTLNFYSKELKESINASAVYFYHGLSTDNYDLLAAVFDKYGIIIFTICLAIVGITILVCVVIFYRRKTRQSIHYLADSKLQQNLQEAVGIDLTPASIILQDEKEEKGNKICDDEGWLVPITDVPVAEDNNVPNIQDTKL